MIVPLTVPPPFDTEFLLVHVHLALEITAGILYAKLLKKL